jgi:GDP-L-fucose synthase
MSAFMKQVIGCKGGLIFNNAKLEGLPRKLIDISRLSNMGWKYSINLEDGLKKTYKWYLNQNKPCK